MQRIISDQICLKRCHLESAMGFLCSPRTIWWHSPCHVEEDRMGLSACLEESRALPRCFSQMLEDRSSQGWLSKMAKEERPLLLAHSSEPDIRRASPQNKNLWACLAIFLQIRYCLERSLSNSLCNFKNVSLSWRCFAWFCPFSFSVWKQSARKAELS